MFSVINLLRGALSSKEPVSVKDKVNLVGISGDVKRFDGIVLSVQGQEALICWPNGGKSFEQVRDLSLIAE